MSSGINADVDAIAAMVPRMRDVADLTGDAVRIADAAGRSLEPALLFHPLRVAKLAVELVEVLDGLRGLRATRLEAELLADIAAGAVSAYDAADEALNAAQLAVVEHPAVVGDVINGISLLSGQKEQAIAGDLARLYPDGRPVVTLVATAHGLPPRSIADLMARLKHRADIANVSPQDGTIDVSRISGRRGIAWVVNLPGTSAWELPGPPADHETDPADFGGDLRLMAGDSSCYVAGVVDALKSLPIKPGQPILLAGHSEGGMVAMAAAGQLRAAGFSVTNVLTAGSPIARFAQPRHVDVLSLENSDDIVPELDGAPNPIRSSWATVRFPEQLGSIGGNHGFGAYGVGAGLADASNDPAVRAWRRQAAPFLSGTEQDSWSFRIERRQ